MSLLNWKNSVKTGGKWDYKNGGRNPEMEHVGNFNYGVTGAAAGLSNTTLTLGAQGYALITNYAFDDPVDQEYIQDGIDYYDENYGN